MNNIRFDIDTAGIGLVTIDMPGRPFNVLSEALIDELEQLIERIEGDTALTGVFFASAKDAFMAGADLAMVRGFTTLRRHAGEATIRRTFSRLSYTLRRLERVAVPTVAAVNGLALGGGLELAMACHLIAIACEAAACLTEGLLATPEDVDVLAVIGLGFPAWTGGPLSLLDMLGRGELAGVGTSRDLPAGPFYSD